MSTAASGELHCANCGIRIAPPGLRRGEDVYCCAGCAMGGPCCCSYDHTDPEAPTKMIMAIVPNEDAPALLRELVALDYRATRIASIGAFLRRGNSVVLVGVSPAMVDGAIGAIRRRCRTRRWPPRATAVPIPGEAPRSAGDITVGGATVFVWDVERYERI